MSKANLTLLGASLSLNADIVKRALADESSLSDADIDEACGALFERKAHHVLCKNVDLAVAASLFGQLKGLGIDCEVEVLEIQDTDGNQNSGLLRNCVLAAVCVSAVAVGCGYFLYSQKSIQSSPIVAEQSAQLPEPVKIAAAMELTEFHHWRDRTDEIESLKRSLEQLSSNRLYTKIVASAGDPLARVTGTNYIAQLEIQRLASGSQDSQNQPHQQKLKDALAAIETLPATLDQFYATLELAGVYQRLRHYDAARSTFELAKNFVIAERLNEATEIVIAEVALAEYQHLYGQTEDRDAHIAAAAAAAADIDREDSSGNIHEWAIAYIARGEAKFGLFMEAHSRLRMVSDEHITESTMVDIANYAASENTEPSVDLLEVTGRDFSVE